MTSFASANASKLGVERRGFGGRKSPHGSAAPLSRGTRTSLPGVPTPGRRGTLSQPAPTPGRRGTSTGRQSVGTITPGRDSTSSLPRPQSTPPDLRLPLSSLRPPSGDISRSSPAPQSPRMLNPSHPRDRQRSIIAMVNQQMDSLLVALDDYTPSETLDTADFLPESATTSPRTAYRSHRDEVRKSLERRSSLPPGPAPIERRASLPPNTADALVTPRGEDLCRNNSVPPLGIGGAAAADGGGSGSGSGANTPGRRASSARSPRSAAVRRGSVESQGMLRQDSAVMSPLSLFKKPIPGEVGFAAKAGGQGPGRHSRRGSRLGGTIRTVKKSPRGRSRPSRGSTGDSDEDYGELAFPDAHDAPLALLSKVEQVNDILVRIEGDDLPQHLRTLVADLRSGLNRQHEHIVSLRRENERLGKIVDDHEGNGPGGERGRSPRGRLSTAGSSSLAVIYTEVEAMSLHTIDPALMRQSLDVYFMTCRAVAARYRGFEVHSGEGSYTAAFVTPYAAVDAALALQTDLIKAPWPRKLQSYVEGVRIFGANCEPLWSGLRVRAGVHWDFASGIHPLGAVAKELAGRARGGETVVSRTCWDLVEEDPTIGKRAVVLRETAESPLVVPATPPKRGGGGGDVAAASPMILSQATVTLSPPSLRERQYFDSSERQVGVLWVKERMREDGELLERIDALKKGLADRVHQQQQGQPDTYESLPAVALVDFQHMCSFWQVDPEKTVATLLTAVDTMLAVLVEHGGRVVSADFDSWRVAFGKVDHAIMFAVTLHERLARIGMLWVTQARRGHVSPPPSLPDSPLATTPSRPTQSPKTELPVVDTSEDCCAAVAIHYDNSGDVEAMNTSIRRDCLVAAAANAPILAHVNALNGGGFTVVTQDAYLNSSRDHVERCHVEHFHRVARPQAQGQAGAAGSPAASPARGGGGDIDVYLACRPDKRSREYTVVHMKRNLAPHARGGGRGDTPTMLARFLDKAARVLQVELDGLGQAVEQARISAGDEGKRSSSSPRRGPTAGTPGSPPDGEGVVVVLVRTEDAADMYDANTAAMAEVEGILSSTFSLAAAAHCGYLAATDGCEALYAFHSLNTAYDWAVDVQRNLVEHPWPSGLFPRDSAAKPHPRLSIGIGSGLVTTTFNVMTEMMEYRGTAVQNAKRLAAWAGPFGGIALACTAHSALDVTRLGSCAVIDRLRFRRGGDESVLLTPSSMDDFYRAPRRQRQQALGGGENSNVRKASKSGDALLAGSVPSMTLSPVSEGAPSPIHALPNAVSAGSLTATGTTASLTPPPARQTAQAQGVAAAPPVPLMLDETEMLSDEGFTEWRVETSGGASRASTSAAVKKVRGNARRATSGGLTPRAVVERSEDEENASLQTPELSSLEVDTDPAKTEEARRAMADNAVKHLASSAKHIEEHVEHMSDMQTTIVTASLDMITKHLSMRTVRRTSGLDAVASSPKSPVDGAPTPGSTNELATPPSPAMSPPQGGAGSEPEGVVLKKQLFGLHRLAREFLDLLKQNANFHAKLDPNHPRVGDEEFVSGLLRVIKAVELEVDLNGVKTQDFRVKWGNYRAALADITNVALDDAGREAVVISSGNTAMVYRSIPGLLVKSHFVLRQCFRAMHRNAGTSGGAGAAGTRPRGASSVAAVASRTVDVLRQRSKIAREGKRKSEVQGGGGDDTDGVTPPSSPAPTPINRPGSRGSLAGNGNTSAGHLLP